MFLKKFKKNQATWEFLSAHAYLQIYLQWLGFSKVKAVDVETYLVRI